MTRRYDVKSYIDLVEKTATNTIDQCNTLKWFCQQRGLSIEELARLDPSNNVKVMFELYDTMGSNIPVVIFEHSIKIFESHSAGAYMLLTKKVNDPKWGPSFTNEQLKRIINSAFKNRRSKERLLMLAPKFRKYLNFDIDSMK